MRATILGVISLMCVATAAQGQLTGLDHIWTVSGIMQTAAGLQAFIPCTNTGTATATIGVEVYGPSGAFVTDGSITVAPNSTVIFGTGGANGISVDVALATGMLTKGSARVMASTTKVVCSAFLADALSAIPSGMTLTIAKKTKQKGD
jgi:hypothetical protein